MSKTIYIKSSQSEFANELDRIVRREFVWYRRLWRFIFPPKNTFTLKEMTKLVKTLKQSIE